MQDFRKLKVWQWAHMVTLRVYRETRSMPASELYGLTAQLRRTSASVAANIAEGCGRGSQRELARSLRIAMGSACELEYHLILARDLGFMTDETSSGLLADVTDSRRMLARLLARVHLDSRTRNS